MIFISILSLIVAKAIPSIRLNLDPSHFTRISAIIFLYSAILSFNTYYIQSIGSGIGIYSGLFQITQISQLIEVFLLVIASLILVSWPLINYYKSEKNSINIISSENLNRNFNDNSNDFNKGVSYSTDYSLIVLFSTLGSCLLISCSDLISLYLSIELQSFGVYILSTLYRESESSTSAGLKYFLLGGLSSCIILLGAGLIYSYSGLTNFEALYTLISVSEFNYILQGIILGLILMIVGFLFKIAAAPLHNWSPDVYDDTPTIVTIWLTIMPKIAIIILLLELQINMGFIGTVNYVSDNAGFLNTFNIGLNPLSLLNIDNSISIIKNLFLISALLSLIIGTVVGLAQTRIKRLLAYSTISHIGFMLLALAINTEQSVDSLLFYLIQYSITNLNIFLVLLALSYLINNSRFNSSQQDAKTNTLSDLKYISELKGEYFKNPLLSISLVISLFSMAGIPPLIGFFSKQFVLYSALQSGYYFIAVVAIIVSVVSASYYLKIIKVLYTEDNESLSENKVSNINVDFNKEGLNNSVINQTPIAKLTNLHSFLISFLTLFVLMFILKPSLILNSTQLLSLSLFNN